MQLIKFGTPDALQIPAKEKPAISFFRVGGNDSESGSFVGGGGGFSSGLGQGVGFGLGLIGLGVLYGLIKGRKTSP